MKILKHGNQYTKTPPVLCVCDNCRCELEVNENDFEGGLMNYFVWCPECKETIYITATQRGRLHFVQEAHS